MNTLDSSFIYLFADPGKGRAPGCGASTLLVWESAAGGPCCLLLSAPSSFKDRASTSALKFDRSIVLLPWHPRQAIVAQWIARRLTRERSGFRYPALKHA